MGFTPWDYLALVGLAVVAALHAYFAAQEARWEVTAPKAGVMGPREAAIAAPLAKNLGFYNGILAAGLGFVIVARVLGDDRGARAFGTFLLVSIGLAGLVGWRTLSRPRIALFQSLPAAVTLVLLWAPALLRG